MESQKGDGGRGVAKAVGKDGGDSRPLCVWVSLPGSSAVAGTGCVGEWRKVEV